MKALSCWTPFFGVYEIMFVSAFQRSDQCSKYPLDDDKSINRLLKPVNEVGGTRLLYHVVDNRRVATYLINKANRWDNISLVPTFKNLSYTLYIMYYDYISIHNPTYR